MNNQVILLNNQLAYNTIFTYILFINKNDDVK